MIHVSQFITINSNTASSIIKSRSGLVLENKLYVVLFKSCHSFFTMKYRKERNDVSIFKSRICTTYSERTDVTSQPLAWFKDKSST